LQDYPFTAARLEEVEKRVDKHVESMTYEHVSGLEYGVMAR
jgi:hypothetical protein